MVKVPDSLKPEMPETLTIITKEEKMSDEANTLNVVTSVIKNTPPLPLTNGPSTVPDSLALLESTTAYLSVLVTQVEYIARHVSGYVVLESDNANEEKDPASLPFVTRLNNLVTKLNTIESDLSIVKGSLEASFGITQ